MRTAQWIWCDVEAMSREGVTELRHLNGGARLTVRGGRLFRGAGYSEATREVRQQLARVGAILRLRERGRYFLHASGAVDPSGRAWILTGDTGAGKSTLAFALSRAGWRVLGDDGVVLQITSTGVIAHAWKEPLRVSLSLAPKYDMLDQVTEAPSPFDERRRVPVHATVAARAPVAGVVLLAQSREYRFERATIADALSALVRQSPWVMLGDPSAKTHYHALHHLVRSVPVFELGHSAAQLDTLATTLRNAA